MAAAGLQLLSAQDAGALFARLAGNIGKVMRGSDDGVRKLLAAFASGGHVLIEDYPGTGKTTLAKSLAASIGAKFTRVQFTPDLLPSDILGVSVFNQKEQVFEFRAGPVFTSILLADEINRASPRTQSALLEVMAEGQVSVEGRTHAIDELFFVVATQNPVEFRGTYPLPSDILGVSVFNQKEQVFEFRAGPVFTSILLADEINRASPRTQSALLEVMAEGQVSVEGRTHAIDELFFVVATQNPVEFRGTYPLPEAQMDRFAMRLSLGYVDAEREAEVLEAQDLGHPLATLRPAATREEMLALKERVRRVRFAPELRRYVVELVRRTRSAPQVQLGCGPRASIAITGAAKALALMDGEEYVRPEHVHELAVPVLAHRMVLDPQARFAGATAAALVADILREVPVPA